MFFLPLFILGLTSLFAQVIMARVLIVSFYGNEFFIGWVLFAWLFWVGVGSLLAARFKSLSGGAVLLSHCHLWSALLIPVTVALIRSSKDLVSAVPGQVPDLLPAMAMSFLIMAPLCLVFGLQFTAAARYGQELNAAEDRSRITARAYVYEAVGFVVAGLLFSYRFVHWNEFRLAALLILVNAVIVLLLSRRKLFFPAVAVFCAGLFCFYFAEPLNTRTTALMFPQAQLLETRNSLYGNLVATRTADQVNLYESGSPAGMDKNGAFNETLVHLPMLAHPAPRKVLLIGGGPAGAMQELLKYDLEKIYYAELDPEMIAFAARHIDTWKEIVQGRGIHMLKGDLRFQLKELPRDLDMVIMALPGPSTALGNRYFTDDFFRELRRHLKPDGIFSGYLAFAPDYVGGPLEELGACIYKTVRRNFSSIVLLPGEELFFLASGQELTRDPAELIRRMKAREVRNSFLTPAAVIERLTSDRVQKLEDSLRRNTTARINTDHQPRGYVYELIYWLSMFHQGVAGLFAGLLQVNYVGILFLAVVLIFLLTLIRGPRAPDERPLLTAMAAGGFSLMAAEIIVIYGFGVVYGALYHKIAWIIAGFMAGIAAGTFLGNSKGSFSIGLIVRLHAGMALYFILGLGLVWSLAHADLVLAPKWWIMGGAGIGILAGLEFAWVSALFLKEKASNMGAVYAADLFGSCLGALMVSLFMLPAYGMYKTLLFLIVVNLAVALALFIARSPGSSRHPHKPRP